MLCLQCKALPSALRTVMRSQMTKLPSQTSILSISSQLRPFSSAKLSQPTTLMTQSLSSLRTSLTSTPSMALNPANAQQTRSFSASASLAGRRATYNPSRRVQKRRHGFLARLKSRGGRRILAHRRSKGKKALSW